MGSQVLNTKNSMKWLSNLFSKTPKQPSCLAKGVAKLWLEKPDEWSQSWGPSFPSDCTVQQGWILHHVLGVTIYTDRFERFTGERLSPNVGRLRVFAGENLNDRVDLLHVAAALEQRPYPALAQYQQDLSEAKKRIEATKDAITKLGCSESVTY